MIDIKYDLSVDEGDGVVSYRFPLEGPIDNFSMIAGDNSLGKSTILNILALAFYGNNNQKIIPSLRSKINELNNYDLTFDISIDLGSLSLRSLKKNGKAPVIEVIERDGDNECQICEEEFERNYNLIYDIPDQTIDRLRRSVGEVINVQADYANRVKAFRNYLLQTIDAIENAPNPEKIEAKVTEIEELKRRKKSLEEMVASESREYEILRKYGYCRFYYELSRSLGNKSDEIKDAREKRDKLLAGMKKGVKVAGKSERDIVGKREAVLSLIDDAAENLYCLIDKKKTSLIKQLRSINVDQAFGRGKFSTDEFDIIFSISKQLGEMRKNISSNTGNIQEAKVYSDLINVLENYTSFQVVIPGVKKSVAEFIDMLKEANSQNVMYAKTIRAIGNAEDSLRKLTEAMDDANKLLEKRKKAEQDGGGTSLSDKEALRQANERINDLDQEIKQIERRKDIYHSEIIKMQIADDEVYRVYKTLENDEIIDQISSLPEKIIIGKIEDLHRQIEDKGRKVSGLKIQIDMEEGELAEMKEAKPHPFQNKIETIHAILNRTTGVEKELASFSTYVNSLQEKKPIDLKSDNIARYHTALSEYLGKRIGVIKYQDKLYDTESIDMVNDIIKFKGGKTIGLGRISTGQSQVAYLLGLLNTEDMRRKMIILLDEVGMISDPTFNLVIDRVKALQREGRVLACLVARISNDTKLSAVKLIA